MASQTLLHNKIPNHINITEKYSNLATLTYKDMEKLPTNVDVDVKEHLDDLAPKDLDTMFKRYEITPYMKGNKKTSRIQKPTTIELVGGILCHICKLILPNKKEFDDHYKRCTCNTTVKVVYTCVECFKQFESYPSFRGHCYTIHVIKDRHQCEQCSKCFSKFMALKDHIQTMHTFKCSPCSKTFKSKNELKLHEVIHNTSNAPPYHCQICEVELSTLEDCKDHADIHTVMIYSCPICNENISSAANASQHLKKHFKNVENDLNSNTKYIPMIQNTEHSENQETSVELLGIACGYCSVIHKNRIDFDAHFSLDHGDEDIVYVCIVCDKTFEKYSVFADHAYNHRSKDRFRCSICEKPFPRLSLLSIHMAVCKTDPEAGRKPFACSLCENTYATEQRLRKHLKDKHGSQCLTCPMDHCDMMFTSPNELILHQEVHKAQHKNWCRQCKLPFPSMTACERHLDVHSRKLFGCPVCSKNYRERHMLTNHLAQHFASVLHICKACGKVYDNRRNFSDHLRTHSDKMVHNCSYCGRGFVKLQLLQQHLNVHTGSKPYKCTICSKSFASYPNWVKHKRRLHNFKGIMHNKIESTSDDEHNFKGTMHNQIDPTSDDEHNFKEAMHNQINLTADDKPNFKGTMHSQINPTSDEEHNFKGTMQNQIKNTSDDERNSFTRMLYNNIDQIYDDEHLDNTNSINEGDNQNNAKECVTEINETDIKLNYLYHLQNNGMETHTDNIDQIHDTVMEPGNIDHAMYVDQVQISAEKAESLIHIAVTKEAQTYSNTIPGVHINANIEFDYNVHTANESLFEHENTYEPTPIAPLEVTNFPLEYGPEFTNGDSYGMLDLDDHNMLPHIDPLLTIKTGEFNMDHNLQQPVMEAGMYTFVQPIFNKVCPEYPYYGDMVDANRLSIMNTDIF